MAEAPPLTRDLALRIERRVGEGSLRAPDQAQDPFPQQAAEFGRTIAVKARGGRPRNKVFCFGHDDIHHLEDILSFYAQDDLEPHFYLAPMGFSRKVARALTAAGFGQCDFEQALLYGLPQDAPVSLPSAVTIEPVTADNLEEFVTATADGFEWHAAWREAAMQGVRTEAAPGERRFLARYEGKPAGVGALRVDEDGVAHVVGGAVVPQYRRKGCHLALVHHRLHVAHQLGCPFVTGAASFNSSSFRNQQRAGLRLAYIESEWTRQQR
ncbi:MAG TPA: GNAT family N-acetyltransferase [Chthonomonadaceae bacterium]|nr:GNAT family N-acetyltransferase [Chthonomonadaceae bacterium]